MNILYLITYLSKRKEKEKQKRTLIFLLSVTNCK